uniref:Uncharacterized protein n=1 Tax=Arundo donax TaxID=35708 RepID=A0A0A8XRI7_ARUDO
MFGLLIFSLGTYPNIFQTQRSTHFPLMEYNSTENKSYNLT